MLASHLTYLLEAQQPADLSRLAEHLPYEWIERAVTATGTASIRRRRLPAEQVVWLVIALAMYRHWSISEVVDSLDLALPNESAAFVSKSAITQARERIGQAPLAWLFKRTAQAWTLQDGARHAIKGLSLWAIDGTTLRTADSPANREHFGAQGYASGKVASYPQVRAVTLTAIPTHLVADIRFGRYDTNEMVYAKDLLPEIPDDSLTVFDRGFVSAEILCSLTMNGRNRHFLIPAKSNTRWEVIAGSAEDAMVRMRTSPQARKKCPQLPGAGGAHHRCTRARAGAADLVDRSAALQTIRSGGLLQPPLADRNQLSGTETVHARHGVDLAQPHGRAGVSGNLGRADRLQPDSPGDRLCRSGGQARTGRHQLRARLAHDPARNDVGRLDPRIRQATRLPQAPARTAQVLAQRKTTRPRLQPGRQISPFSLLRPIHQTGP
ncbi:membrane protein (plasmid) [Ralstonia solanacearum]|nr:membrane protein [Ralstonia solanacearum]